MNRCYTEVAIFGKCYDELIDLYNRLSDFYEYRRNRKYKDIYEADLCKDFGLDTSDAYAFNGWIDKFELQKDCLRIYQSDSGYPNTYFWQQILEENYDTLDYVYLAQEPYMCVFINTDESHHFFDYEKYVISALIYLECGEVFISARSNDEDDLLKQINECFEKASIKFDTLRDFFRFYLSVPYDCREEDPMGLDFICYTNPWIDEGNLFSKLCYEIRNEPGWVDPVDPYEEEYEEVFNNRDGSDDES